MPPEFPAFASPDLMRPRYTGLPTLKTEMEALCEAAHKGLLDPCTAPGPFIGHASVHERLLHAVPILIAAGMNFPAPPGEPGQFLAWLVARGWTKR